MAELILATISLSLAGPSIVLAFAEGGAYIKAKVDQYKNAPSIIINIGTFAYELYSGQLSQSLKLANWAYSQDSIDVTVKCMLEDQIEQLRLGLVSVDRELDRCFDEHGVLKRYYFSTRGSRHLKATRKELERWQQSFFRTISLIEMTQRIVPDPLLLTATKFKTTPGLDGNDYHILEAGSHIKCAKGQILDDKLLREVSVVTEQKHKMTTGITEVKEIAACLSSQSGRTATPRGVLRCLGYREEPLELVFEIPNESSKLRTLSNLIQADLGQGHAGRRPLDYRYCLARQISETVLSIHTLNRVHKNIRPDTILMICAQSQDFGTPYIIDWTMLRKINAPSSMVGENDWQKDIYRHPRRQGLQPETRYNMGHDIYSLGVCLLSIGLWKPLVDSSDGVLRPCEEYRETALRLKLIKPEEMDKIRNLPLVDGVEKLRLIKILMKPTIIDVILSSMAEYYLPSQMGLGFAKTVVNCLKCLNGSFGDVKIFEDNRKQAVGVKFSEIVLQPLSQLAGLMGAIPESGLES